MPGRDMPGRVPETDALYMTRVVHFTSFVRLVSRIAHWAGVFSPRQSNFATFCSIAIAGRRQPVADLEPEQVMPYPLPAMSSHLFALLAVLLIALPARAGGDDILTDGRDGVLLLRNGEVIRGRIASAGDDYDVGLPDGEIRIRAVDVEFVGRDIEQCYEQQRSAIESGKPEEHLSLAEWCLRHRLLKQAAHEIGDAVALEPAHPKIALLERRLKLLAEETQSEKAPRGKPTERVQVEQLDRMVRGMPPGSMEVFTQTVQPLLVNHCSSAGCHGPQSGTSFRLMRVAAGRGGSRRTTQRNLHATLALVNREAPGTSALLTVPVRAHGPGKVPVFTDRQASQYRQIVLWVNNVANYSGPQAPAKLSEPAAPLLQTVAASKVPPIAARDFAESAAAAHAAVPGAAASVVRQPQRKEPQRGAAADEYVPRDDFDPELFNRGLTD